MWSGVCVSWGCLDKLPQLQWHELHKSIISQFSKLEFQDQGSVGLVLSGTVREESAEPSLPASGGFLAIMAVFSACLHMVSSLNSPFKKILLFVYLFLAVLGLHCWASFSLAVAIKGYSLVAVHGLLVAVASLVGQHGFRVRGFHCAVYDSLRSCGTPAYLLNGTWDLPRPGIEPMTPALAGRFFTTEAPGKPPFTFA